MLTLFDNADSGNAYKVRLLLGLLGTPYQRVEVDSVHGETRTPGFLRRNPNGKVPALQLEDGSYLWESNALLWYLAAETAYLPEERRVHAEVLQWMFFEQYSHEPYVAVCCFHMVYKGEPKETREAWRVQRGEAALDALETALTDREFLVGTALTIADIALLAYTRLAEEGGFDLASRPAVGNWIARCEAVLNLD